MKKYLKKDQSLRYKFHCKEKKLMILKFINFSNYNSLKIDINLKKKISFIIFSLKCSSITYIRNRCIITGRGKAVYRKLKISRLILKHYINYGFISLIKNSNN